MNKTQTIQGDCLTQLKLLESESVDSLITDPPAGISFMGKDWDSDKGGRDQWVKWMSQVMKECARILKPGAHGLVWALPRTSHWTATALEDAGFEVRDVVTHLFGSGFPKSHNIEKAGAGKQWAGWGTALKPASEHWILVRKPLGEKTVTANVLKYGCGGINIDGSRVESVRPAQTYTAPDITGNNYHRAEGGTIEINQPANLGRFPANLVFSCDCESETHALDCSVRQLDEQSGIGKSPTGYSKRQALPNIAMSGGNTERIALNGHGDSGGASRFFYCAKISKSERNAGCEDMLKEIRRSDARPNSGDDSGKFPDHDSRERSGNHHPTVKPKKLMAYLIRLITPHNGTVLDPFMGSGSTGIAAKENGFQFIGIERDPEYFEIANKRIFNSFPEFKKQTHGSGDT